MDSRTLLRAWATAVLTLALSAPLAAAPIRVTGRVLAEKGGLSGAQVELFPAYESYADALRRLTGKAGPAPIAQAVTDAGGAFAILAPESGCFRVEIRAEGYLARETVLLPLVEDVELPSATLIPASPLEVRTVGPDGRPLPGIEIRLLDVTPLTGRGRQSQSWTWSLIAPDATTGPDGRASLPWYRNYGRPLVVAASPRFLGQTVTGKPGEALTLRLVPGRTGWIEVRGAGSKPVAGALARWHGLPVGITGPDGRMEIAVPEEGAALTLESREGWRAQGVRMEGKGVLPIRLEPPRRIAGRVVDAVRHAPVAGAVVWSGAPLDAPAVRSGADGTFVLDVPAAEESWLRAGSVGFLPAERQRVKKGAAEPPVLALAPAVALSGKVVDAKGRPVAGADVTIDFTVDGRHPSSRRLQSRPDGDFRFPQVPPGGVFPLTATHPGFARTTATARTSPVGQPSPPVRIVMSDGQTAFGRVVDSEGRPVAGAELTMSTDLGERFEAVSDATGRFVLRPLTPGQASLLATHPRHASILLEIEIPSGTQSLDLGTLRLPAAEGLEGRVADSRGRPIEGAEVFVYPALLRSPGRLTELRRGKETLRTGPDGTFRAGHLEGGKRYDLTVLHEQYVTVSLPGVEAPTAEPLRIEMKAARSLSGQVVGPEEEPVVGASLSWVEEIRSGGGWSSSTRPLGTTDAGGGFRVSGLPPGSIILAVTAEGYAPGRIEGLQILEDGDLEGLRITLARGNALDVRVLTAEGEPVEGITVQASPAEHGTDSSFGFPGSSSMGYTDSRGRCRLTLPKPGTYHVNASGLGTFANARVTAGTGTTSVELSFPPGVEVAGRVTGEDGTGVAGALVLLEAGEKSRSNQTGPDGTFVLFTVADGVYRLQAFWEDRLSDPRDLTVAGAPVQGLEIRLDRQVERATLTGRLLGLSPEEIQQVRVNAFRPGSSWPPPTSSVDREGGYRVEGLEPGEWTLQALVPPSRLARGTLQIPTGAREATLDLEFPKGFTLAGRVLVDGRPFSNGIVDAMAKASSTFSTRTAHDGTFTLHGLAAGPVTLVIVGSQGFLGTYPVHLAKDQEVSISLTTGSLTGRVLAATGEPAEEATVSLAAWLPALTITVSAPGARTGADGTFEIPGLGAGTYQIHVRKEGFAPAGATAEVRAGGSAPVAVVLKPQEETP